MKKLGAFSLWLAAVAASLPAAAAGLRPPMVDAKTELAIKRGLEFLAQVQHKRGSWSGGTGYGARYEAAMTGLAGVALLSSGSTPTRGPYAKNIRLAIRWVLRQQQATGLICSMGEESRSMYGHGFCTLFLAECLGTTGSRSLELRIRKALEKAIKLTEGSQSKLGGWIYTPSQNSDEGSVTVTQVQALRACQMAGVQVNRKVMEKAYGYLKKAQGKDGGIAYSARQRGRGGSRPAITAAALTCLYSAARYDAPVTKGVEKYILNRYKKMLNRSGHFYYTQLYLSEALYQHGGKPWRDHYPRIRKWLLANKVEKKVGGVPTYAWQGDNVGLTYGTSIALIVLQLPYGYLPVLQK